MQNHNARLLTITAGTLFFVGVFVAWRAQTFHYCVQPGERERKSRFADLSETCSPDEQPMGWRDLWQVEGARSKIKMLGRTTAEAFGLNRSADSAQTPQQPPRRQRRQPDQPARRRIAVVIDNKPDQR
jgi:hypothetical protein